VDEQGKITEEDMKRDVRIWALADSLVERIKDIPADTPFLINLIDLENEEASWDNASAIVHLHRLNYLRLSLTPFGQVCWKTPTNPLRESNVDEVPLEILRDKFRENWEQPFLTCTILDLDDPTSTEEAK